MSTDPNATPTPAPAPSKLAVILAWGQRNHLIAWVGFFSMLIGWSISAYSAARTGAPIPDLPAPPVIVDQTVNVNTAEKEPGHGFGQGWIADPDEVAAVVAELPPTLRVFSDTPAGKIQTAEMPKFVYGWKAYEQLFARPPPVKNQGQVGSCVSFGTDTAIERTLAAEIVRRKGTAQEWSRFVEEATYGGSRVEIGGGRIRGDGSVGAWAAQFVTKFGVVPRKAYPTLDLTNYSETLCRQWGSSGVPAIFEAEARKFPVKSFTQVKVWEEAKAAMAQGYFIAICSNQGFSNKRDANGVAQASGSWGHCMACDGYHITEDKREYGHIVNSWGTDWISGPTGFGNPGGDGFWAESAVIDRMLKQGDSWAFSGVTGFPRRVIDWNVLAPRPATVDRLTLRPARPVIAQEVVLKW